MVELIVVGSQNYWQLIISSPLFFIALFVHGLAFFGYSMIGSKEEL
jgi:hypothetical protein